MRGTNELMNRYPSYYLSKIGDKRVVLEENSDNLFPAKLSIELTSVGVLWELEKNGCTLSSGQPIVQVAYFFDNSPDAKLRDKIIANLESRRRELEKEIRKIDDEISVLS